MFILTKISDLVQITPEDFSKPSKQAIEDNINAKYANKVIQKIGLCICLYDLLTSSEGLIGHGTGLVNVNVEFRLVVFRMQKTWLHFNRTGLIEEEEWIDQTPEKPESDTAMDEEERRARRLSPWRIVASMADDGLGPCFWWDEDEEPEE
ncbi:hypothetical protein V495_04911 [Pseudogymnoascus sp. VKM F-4514 (FW-929)]|nr:hypothetical protein V495_04911 [Pseudogymnoascus sp. VKM F-4514 (FW-929)]